MKEDIPETLSPEECAGKIFELSGVKFEPDIALDLWGKILQQGHSRSPFLVVHRNCPQYAHGGRRG